MNIYDRPTPRTDAVALPDITDLDYIEIVDLARRLEQELETCRDAHMANCLAMDTLRREIEELRAQLPQDER